jgi:hypothetical protein
MFKIPLVRIPPSFRYYFSMAKDHETMKLVVCFRDCSQELRIESEETPSASGLLLGREPFFWAIKGRFNRRVIPNRNGMLFL